MRRDTKRLKLALQLLNELVSDMENRNFYPEVNGDFWQRYYTLTGRHMIHIRLPDMDNEQRWIAAEDLNLFQPCQILERVNWVADRGADERAKRQERVLELSLQGKTVKEIAHVLQVGRTTILQHRQVLRDLGKLTTQSQPLKEAA